MVASLARRNYVIPTVLTAFATWDHMVERHLRVPFTAILADIAVPLEDLSPRKFPAVQRFADHVDKADHLGTFEHPRDSVWMYSTPC